MNIAGFYVDPSYLEFGRLALAFLGALVLAVVAIVTCFPAIRKPFREVKAAEASARAAEETTRLAVQQAVKAAVETLHTANTDLRLEFERLSAEVRELRPLRGEVADLHRQLRLTLRELRQARRIINHLFGWLKQHGVPEPPALPADEEAAPA